VSQLLSLNPNLRCGIFRPTSVYSLKYGIANPFFTDISGFNQWFMATFFAR
jgi:hypothetical protein